MQTQDIRVEGITQTNARTWAVVGSRPGASVIPERSPRVLVILDEFRGIGSKAAAIRAAGTNRVVSTAGATLRAMGAVA